MSPLSGPGRVAPPQALEESRPYEESTPVSPGQVLSTSLLPTENEPGSGMFVVMPIITAQSWKQAQALCWGGGGCSWRFLVCLEVQLLGKIGQVFYLLKWKKASNILLS